jgi:hypothetical protein
MGSVMHRGSIGTKGGAKKNKERERKKKRERKKSMCLITTLRTHPLLPLSHV